SYGVHWCANVVCGADGLASAVLLRALEPVEGLEAMRAARGPAYASGGRRDRDLCRGPGRLCQALGLDRAFNGADLAADNSGVWLADDGTPPPDDPCTTPRIGISAARDDLLRFTVCGHPGVSGRTSWGSRRM